MERDEDNASNAETVGVTAGTSCLAVVAIVAIIITCIWRRRRANQSCTDVFCSCCFREHCWGRREDLVMPHPRRRGHSFAEPEVNSEPRVPKMDTSVPRACTPERSSTPRPYNFEGASLPALTVSAVLPPDSLLSAADTPLAAISYPAGMTEQTLALELASAAKTYSFSESPDISLTETLLSPERRPLASDSPLFDYSSEESPSSTEVS